MANFDDIFNSQPKEETEGQSFAPFDKDEWAAQKKQERENAFALIDETAQHMTNDGELFQSYLDVQAHFDRYSVGNAILITAQKPDATQLADFKGWKDNGVYIKKGESGIVLLEPGEEYTKDDGSIGVSYNSKKVFDITQTNAKPRENAGIKRDERMLLKALIHNAPCPIEISQHMYSSTSSTLSLKMSSPRSSSTPHGDSSVSVMLIRPLSLRTWNICWIPYRQAPCFPTLSLLSCSTRRHPTVRSSRSF